MALLASLTTVLLAATTTTDTFLLHQPTASADRVAFVYAGDLWAADLDGGNAARLTVLPAAESDPHFSPDGQWIAFTGQYDGNVDVYVVPAAGGNPTRLTWHPGADQVRGWSADGQSVLFRTGRESANRADGRLALVDVKGGLPRTLPLPMAERGSLSPDGKFIAYTPIADAFTTWKRYRGGMQGGIWICDLESLDVVKIPREDSNDSFPAWRGGEVYFLSDRHHVMNVFAYDVNTRQVRQVTFYSDYDVKALTAGPAGLVYEQAARLHFLDPESGEARPLSIQVIADLPATRPHFVDATDFLRNFDVSPTGKRAVIESRGEIITVPAKKGADRNLTRSPGVHDRDPAWSPDGSTIACFSDQSGEYQLVLYDQAGQGEPRAIDLGSPPSFFHRPRWSPDGTRILYTDKRLNLFHVNVEEEDAKPVHVDQDHYDHPQRTLDPVWSSDSRWIAYTKRLSHHYRAVFLHDVEAGETHQLSNGLSDATSACFDREGKYLYFTASTNYGLNTGWLDMSSYERPVRRHLYLVVLSSEDPSPFAFESDEEEVAEEDADPDAEGDAEADGEDGGESDAEDSASDLSKLAETMEDAVRSMKKAEGAGPFAANPMTRHGRDDGDDAEDADGEEEEDDDSIRIDLDGIDQRILSLPLPASGYGNLQALPGGKLLYLEVPEGARQATLHSFDLAERKSTKIMDGVTDYRVSHDGKKILVQGMGGSFQIADAGAPISPGSGAISLASVQIRVEPRIEWAQMFREAWRVERDYFYDPEMHGADWPAMYEKYAPFVEHAADRADINYLISEMIGEMVVGHNYVFGGDQPDVDRVRGGLLGADLAVENGRYRITRIYDGENWNPDLRAPLTEPGVDVREGDSLLRVNGVELSGDDNVFRLFERTAGRPVELVVNDGDDPENERTVTVVPIDSEATLRNRAWVEGNRRRVDERTGGRVAYVYLPNTAQAGYTYFTRYYYSQLDRQAAVIDERFNGGGSAADFIVDMMDRPLLSNWATREGHNFTTPNAAIFGPKVMIINEYAGSGGDALPLYFSRRGIGQLVGKTTWGGLVGIYDYPPLIDGGVVMAPRVAIFSPDGEWEVENVGVPPDIEVEMTPKAFAAGIDPQLEKAIDVVLAELDANPVTLKPRPAPPNRVK